MIPSLQNHAWMIINAFLILLLLRSEGMGGARRFTITNRCSEPIWHVVFDNATQQSEQYEVFVGSSVAFRRPNGWTGSVWGKTGCVFNDTSCATGDTPSFTRAEFILASPGYLDFYYVSLLDGFNLPLVVKPIGGPGSGSGCGPTGCIADLNQICPTELRTQGGAVCRSECVAFGTPEYCCSGNYSGPEKCAPTNYSRVFTEACPTAYSYLYDAANSTFSCNSTSDYFITFCPPIGKNRAKEIITVVSASVSGVIIVSIIVCCFLKRRQNSPQRKRNRDVENLLLQHGALAPKRYRYSEIKKMTRSLSDKLGQGGFGSVYKGTLPDGRLVAVKILSEMDSNGEEFINEVASISRTFHVNIVTLLGFCHEGNKSALVYEYMPKKSLDKFLGNNGDGILDLNKLYEIVVGIAKGLEYLHTGCITRIVHFDIKPQNILLDQDLCPKISDFGLAKLCKKKQSVLSVLGTRGTAGYIAPEVFSRNFGGVSHKSDVYSYGMMLLEMAGARKIVGTQMIESSENYFPDEIYEQVIIDVTNSLDGEWMMIEEEEEKRRKMMLIGFWCIQTIPSERPSISKVVEMLEGTLRSIQIPPKPFLFSTVIPNQETSFSSFSANVETENS